MPKPPQCSSEVEVIRARKEMGESGNTLWNESMHCGVSVGELCWGKQCSSRTFKCVNILVYVCGEMEHKKLAELAIGRIQGKVPVGFFTVPLFVPVNRGVHDSMHCVCTVPGLGPLTNHN